MIVAVPADTLEGKIHPRDAMTPLVLAIDVGTSSVRAAIYDAAAREVASTQSQLVRRFCTTAHGGSEVEADDAFRDVARAIDESLRLAASAKLAHVGAVAVSCFWHSLVGVDAEGRALTPVYGWADTRAAEDAARLRDEFDERATHARTGCRFHSSYWPAKFRWLRRERADAWRASAGWMTFGEYLTLRLCGETRASISMASGTGIFNQRECDWDATLAEGLGLRAERLPALARDDESLAISDEHAARWPALRGARLFPATGDGGANNVGEGCTSRERVALMVGTSGAMRVAYEGEPPAALDSGLWCYRINRRRVVVGGALSDGGGLFAWLRNSLAQPASEEEFERAVAELAPDAHGLTILPFWAGERSTGWNAHASGSILGLTAHTRPFEIVRAALEAVAYRFASIAHALEAHAPGARITASGGALRLSLSWPQIIADVLGRPLHLSGVHEASSRGAALLALASMGAIKSLDDAEAPTSAAIAPDAARREIYLRGLERQRAFYELLVNDQEAARMLETRNVAADDDDGAQRCDDEL